MLCLSSTFNFCHVVASDRNKWENIELKWPPRSQYLYLVSLKISQLVLKVQAGFTFVWCLLSFLKKGKLAEMSVDALRKGTEGCIVRNTCARQFEFPVSNPRDEMKLHTQACWSWTGLLFVAVDASANMRHAGFMNLMHSAARFCSISMWQNAVTNTVKWGMFSLGFRCDGRLWNLQSVSLSDEPVYVTVWYFIRTGWNSRHIELVYWRNCWFRLSKKSNAY
jgi:hypothetical protein